MTSMIMRLTRLPPSILRSAAEKIGKTSDTFSKNLCYTGIVKKHDSRRGDLPAVFVREMRADCPRY